MKKLLLHLLILFGLRRIVRVFTNNKIAILAYHRCYCPERDHLDLLQIVKALKE